MCVIVTSQADTMPSLTQLARVFPGRASHGTTANASTATATKTT